MTLPMMLRLSLPARSQSRVGAEPPQYLYGLRDRRSRWQNLHSDGNAPGTDSQPPDRAETFGHRNRARSDIQIADGVDAAL